jgi:hypothetical protein
MPTVVERGEGEDFSDFLEVGNLGFFRSDLVNFFSSYSSLSIVSIHLHTLLFVNTVNISCSCRSSKMIALSDMLFYLC